MGLFDDDICWCSDSDRCDKFECFRHMTNRMHQSELGVFTSASLMGTRDCPYFEEEKEEDEEDEEVKYVITPWGCLVSVLFDYGIDVSHFKGRVGEHIVEDFMEAMERAGYVSKGENE